MAAVPITTAIQTSVANLYISILGRNPEPAGFGYWTNALANNGGTPAAVNAIAIGFSGSPEFVATYGGLTTAQAVNTFYTNILNRTADAAGSTYWQGIANGYIASGYTISQAYALTANSLIITAAANTGTADAILIANKETAAIATGTAAPSTTYTLTTGIDALGMGAFINGEPTGNSVINAVDGGTNGTTQTWSALDSITATGSNNTFNVASASAISNPAGAVVTGVQTMNVTEAGANAGVTLSTTTFTGLTQLNVTNAGTGTDTLTAAATTNVTEILAAGGTDVINGGQNVSVTKTQVDAANTTTFGTITIGATTAPTGTISVTNTDTNATFTGFADTAIAVTGGNGVTITDSVTSGIALGAANAVTYTQKGTNGVVTINNNFTVSSTGAAQAVTSNAVTVNGSATTTDAGATTITVNNTATATQVAVTPSTITQGAVGIAGGTATTSVTVNQAATATAHATVAAVAGVKGVGAVTAVPGTNGATLVNAVGVSKAIAGNVGAADGQVTIADVNGGSGTVANSIATVSLSSIGTGSSITSSALTTLNLAGVSTAGATLAITDNLTAHTNANVLNLNTTAATGGVVISAGKVGTLNITNSGTSALGAFTDANLTAVTVAGSGVITLLANSATTETVTGAAGVTQTIDNTVVTFNASGTTGTSTITTSTTGTKVITAGTGVSDELILAANSTWTATTGGKFVGFEVLGLGNSITQDASVFGAGINKLDLTATAETDVITKLNSGASINLKGGAVTTTSLTATYADTNGATDATTITFAGETVYNATTGAETAGAQTVTTLVLNDANGVGIGTLNIVDNNPAFYYAGDNITNVTNPASVVAISNLNFSGVGGFAIGGTAGATPADFVNTVSTMTINNTGTNLAGLVVGMTDNSLGNLNFTGTGATKVNLVDHVAGTLNITNSGTGTVNVVDDGATVAANVNLTGALTANITDNNVTTLTLAASQSVTFADTGATGLTISGAADNNRVSVNLGAAAATKTNSITLGNGNNNIVDVTTAGTSTITVGTGSNLINAGVATFNNNSTGLFNITVGTHAAATVANEIIAGTGGTNYATVANYVLTGLTTGDQVAFGIDAASIASGSQVATSLAGAATVAGALSTLETAAHAIGIHGTAWGVYLGNTYVVEDGTGTLGAQTTTVVELAGLSSTTTGALNFSNGGFTIGSTGTAPVVDSGASHTFTLAAAQTFTSSYTGGYTITTATGAGDTITLSAVTGAIGIVGGASTSANTIVLTGSTGAETIGTSIFGDTITTGITGTVAITDKAGATHSVGDTITLTAGHGVATITTNAASINALSAAISAGVDSVSGFAIATDKLVTGSTTLGTLVATDFSATATISAAGLLTDTAGTTFAVLLADAVTAAASAHTGTVVFQSGTDAYAVHAVAVTGAEIVKLVGITGITGEGIAAAANTVVLA